MIWQGPQKRRLLELCFHLWSHISFIRAIYLRLQTGYSPGVKVHFAVELIQLGGILLTIDCSVLWKKLWLWFCWQTNSPWPIRLEKRTVSTAAWSPVCSGESMFRLRWSNGAKSRSDCSWKTLLLSCYTNTVDWEQTRQSSYCFFICNWSFEIGTTKLGDMPLASTNSLSFGNTFLSARSSVSRTLKPNDLEGFGNIVWKLFSWLS